jgi:hypothetical protein
MLGKGTFTPASPAISVRKSPGLWLRLFLEFSVHFTEELFDRGIRDYYFYLEKR